MIPLPLLTGTLRKPSTTADLTTPQSPSVEYFPAWRTPDPQESTPLKPTKSSILNLSAAAAAAAAVAAAMSTQDRKPLDRVSQCGQHDDGGGGGGEIQTASHGRSVGLWCGMTDPISDLPPFSPLRLNESYLLGLFIFHYNWCYSYYFFQWKFFIFYFFNSFILEDVVSW